MKTLATFFGQNLVNPDRYAGWSGDLGGCVWDATNWSVWATQFPGAQVNAILSERKGTRQPGYIGQFPPYEPSYGATREAFIARVTRLAEIALAGDTVIIGNSGHGTKFATLREGDLEGEAMCFADGLVKDWELQDLLCNFDSYVRVIVLLDTCFSGGMERGGFIREKFAPPIITDPDRALSSARSTSPPKKATPKASCLILSACGENQTAGDTPLGGIFTMSAIRVWNGYAREERATLTPREWIEDTAQFIKNYWQQKQEPQVKVLGPDLSDTPFFETL